MGFGGKLNGQSSNLVDIEKDDESAEANFVDARGTPVSTIPIITNSSSSSRLG